MIWRYRRRVDAENRRQEDSWSWLSNTIAWVQNTPAPYDPRDVTTATSTTSTTSIASTTLTPTGTVGSDTNLPSNFASVAPHSHHLRFQQSYSILQSRPPSEDGSHESECFSFITAAGSQTSLITFSTAGSMWEDNNPLSYDRRSSTSSFRAPGDHSPTGSDIEPPDFLTRPPRTPPETSGDEAGSRHSDEDEDGDGDEQYQRRDQVYNSRVEQTLLEHRDLPIVITDAGKNSEGSGGFIVYTIRTGVCSPIPSPPLSASRLSKIRRNSWECT